MDPLMLAILSIGIKEGLPMIISIMQQAGMTEMEINETWKRSYERFKNEDPNLLPN